MGCLGSTDWLCYALKRNNIKEFYLISTLVHVYGMVILSENVKMALKCSESLYDFLECIGVK
jgi:hypothetical protein